MNRGDGIASMSRWCGGMQPTRARSLAVAAAVAIFAVACAPVLERPEAEVATPTAEQSSLPLTPAAVSPPWSCNWPTTSRPTACPPSSPAFSGTWSGITTLDDSTRFPLSLEFSPRADNSVLAYTLAGTHARSVVNSAICGDQLYLQLEERFPLDTRTWCVSASLSSDTHLFGSADDSAHTRSVSLTKRPEAASPLREHRFLFWRGSHLPSQPTGALELAVATDPDLNLPPSGFYSAVDVGAGWPPFGVVTGFGEAPVPGGVDTTTALHFDLLGDDDDCPGSGQVDASFDPATGLYSGSVAYTGCNGLTAYGPVVGKRAQSTTSADVGGMLATLAALGDAMNWGNVSALPGLFSDSYLHDHVDKAGRLTLLGREIADYDLRRVTIARIRSAVSLPEPYALPDVDLRVQMQFAEQHEGEAVGTNKWVTYRDTDTSEPGNDELALFRDEDGAWRFYGNQVGPAIPVEEPADGGVEGGDADSDASVDAGSDAPLDDAAEKDAGPASLCKTKETLATCSMCSAAACALPARGVLPPASAALRSFGECLCDPPEAGSASSQACLAYLPNMSIPEAALATCLVDMCGAACGFANDGGWDGASGGYDAGPTATPPDLATCAPGDMLLSAPPALEAGKVPWGRHLGAGRHTVAPNGPELAVWMSGETNPPAIVLAPVGPTFSKPRPADVNVGEGSATLLDSDPVLASGPVGVFVAAWTDFGADGDERGIALRRWDPNVPSLSAVLHANAGTAFTQRDPDILWVPDARQYVVAWTDESLPANGPDVVLRAFDEYLVPATSKDVDLARGPDAEGLVALGRFGSTWAAAWRAGAAGSDAEHAGLEQVRAISGSSSWATDWHLAGPSGERPAIAEIDATHVAVAYAVGADRDLGAVAPRVRVAVFETGTTAPVGVFSLTDEPTSGPGGDEVAQSEPNLLAADGHLFVTWKTDAVPGDAYAEEIWIGELAWSGDTLAMSEPPAPLPRTNAHRAGDQRHASIGWNPLSGAFGAVWEDYGRTVTPNQATPDIGTWACDTPMLDVDGGTGASCLASWQCESGNCDHGFCAAATCSDGVANGSETDVDCGGGCAPCLDGELCVSAGDCQSGICGTPHFCVIPDCYDGVKNGTETDLDCGGPACPRCSPGKACLAWTDCSSVVCTANVCAAPTCGDGEMNGNETWFDCGGGACPPCASGSGCHEASDCVSGVCANWLCAFPTCTDGVKNGDETDVDCGGVTGCSPCTAGQACLAANDCDSSLCTGGLCPAPTCTDGVRNADEIDVDCGGSCAAGCSYGQHCSQGGDCESGICRPGGTCSSCGDGRLSGMESDVDCGGECASCDVGAGCVQSNDCASGVCASSTCVAPACDDGFANGDETGVDCGGASCSACPSGPPPLPAYGSCMDVLQAHPTWASGVYVIAWNGAASPAFCDMDVDGGGWTAFFSGTNGTANAFADFEGGLDVCPSASNQCLRMLEPVAPDPATTWGLVTCGTDRAVGAAVKFQLDYWGWRYFRNGLQASWSALLNRSVVAGTSDAALSAYLWTGYDSWHGWAVSAHDGVASHTFADARGAVGDYCNGVADTSSRIRLLFR